MYFHKYFQKVFITSKGLILNSRWFEFRAVNSRCHKHISRVISIYWIKNFIWREFNWIKICQFESRSYFYVKILLVTSFFRRIFFLLLPSKQKIWYESMVQDFFQRKYHHVQYCSVGNNIIWHPLNHKISWKNL